MAFSGGVGEFVCDALADRPLPPPGAYDDLGIESAAAITRTPALTARAIAPEGSGRATVLGLLRHLTQVPARRCICRPAAAPPVICRSSARSPPAPPSTRSPASSSSPPPRGPRARSPSAAPSAAPIVALLEANAAKARGAYATDWGRRPVPLAVLDEVSARGAEVVRIGAPARGALPLSFFRLGR